MKKNTVKALRTNVTIAAYRGYWRLQLSRKIAGGKQAHIYTGLDATTQNHRKASIVALQIEADLEAGCFDGTLEKYRASFEAEKNKLRNQVIIAPKYPDLKQLWSGYCDFKESQVSNTTFHQDFLGRYFNAIKSLPSLDIKNAIAIRDHLIATRPTYSAKRLLIQINACCKWALKSGLIAQNPFDGLATDIKVKRWGRDKIDPFTPTEREAIIQAFESHTLYSGYTSFIRFLFLTGARPGEAIALRWQHINSKCTEIYFCESFSRHGRSPTTKTGESRKFPCNSQLQHFLLNIRPNKYRRDALVFPSLTDEKEIKISYFTSVVWRSGVINNLVQEGLVQRYRPVYTCRSTFITECLEVKISAQQVAKWVGNSPEIIFQHYAGILSDTDVPEF
ncbi:site-specific integrase [Calothrix membranacea FACHB-236]|nr:site-specific integrase [Calothrix membranacea FACHB-236]